MTEAIQVVAWIYIIWVWCAFTILATCTVFDVIKNLHRFRKSKHHD